MKAKDCPEKYFLIRVLFVPAIFVLCGMASDYAGKPERAVYCAVTALFWLHVHLAREKYKNEN